MPDMCGKSCGFGDGAQTNPNPHCAIANCQHPGSCLSLSYMAPQTWPEFLLFPAKSFEAACAARGQGVPRSLIASAQHCEMIPAAGEWGVPISPAAACKGAPRNLKKTGVQQRLPAACPLFKGPGHSESVIREMVTAPDPGLSHARSITHPRHATCSI